MPPTAVGGSGRPADLGIRFGARVIDAILVGIVNAIIASIIIVPMIFSDFDGNTNFMMNTGLNGVGFVLGLIGVALSLGYFVWLETSRGQTVGKMLLGLEVRNASGGRPSAEESLKRNAFLALSIIPILGGLLQLAAVIYIAITINQAADRRGWHDQFAGTMVVSTK